MNPTLVLILGGGLAFLLLIVGIVLSMTGERAQLEERLRGYLGEEERKEVERQARESVVRQWLDTQVERTSWWENIARDLAQADLKLKPVEYLLLRFGFTVLGVAAGYVFGGRKPLFVLLGFLLGFFGLRFLINFRRSRRLAQFNSQLPDMLNLMVNALRAGYSTMQALEAVSREMPPPISEEFRRVVQEMQIGIPMERALEHLLRRVPSDDLDLVVTAMLIQREVGGNLAEILETISTTIRERVRIMGEIRTLTAQVRLSGNILALAPLFVFFIVYRINPDYMGQFLVPENRLCGGLMLGLGIAMIGTGYYIMRRIANIEV